MPTNLQEFQEDTAFERYLLDRVTPLLPRSDALSVLRLQNTGTPSVSAGAGTAEVSVRADDSTGSPRDQLSIETIRPLLFGTAWKVLDLLIELGLEQAGLQYDQRNNKTYRISTKVDRARDDDVQQVAPFDSRRDLWSRVMKTYASTDRIRHSLVHRQVHVSQGKLTEDPDQQRGPTLQTLTSDEQSAFCRVAAGTAEAVIGRKLETRRADQLGWLLDQLTAHHGHPPLGTSPVSGMIPQVIVPTSPGPLKELTLDLEYIRGQARHTFSDASHFDLKIHLPDGRVLAGPLEDAPETPDTFPTEPPPAWLHWE